MTSAPPPTNNPVDTTGKYRSLLGIRIRDGFVQTLLFLCAAFSVIITFTIVVVLILETRQFFVQTAVHWRESAPERIEFTEGAIARATAKIEQAENDVAQATDAADAKALAEARSDLAAAHASLAFETKNLVRWQWKQEHAHVGGVLRNFLGTSTWSPQYTQDYGIWPLISGTVLVSLIAMAVALPLGLITAIYLSEYAPRKIRATLKPTLEVLAGIPTVVYGYFALRIVTPGLIELHDGFNGFNALSAGLMVGVLCLPIVTSLAEDALQAVPRSLRDAAYGLGSTRFDVSMKVVVPAALSGIVSAFLLAIARAVGETMIVALAAGSTAKLTFDPRLETQTMTGYMVQIMGGEGARGTPEYLSLYAVAAVLFVMTLSLTILGNLVRKRFREAYQ